MFYFIRNTFDFSPLPYKKLPRISLMYSIIDDWIFISSSLSLLIFFPISLFMLRPISRSILGDTLCLSIGLNWADIKIIISITEVDIAGFHIYFRRSSLQCFTTVIGFSVLLSHFSLMLSFFGFLSYAMPICLKRFVYLQHFPSSICSTQTEIWKIQTPYCCNLSSLH